MCVGGAVSCCVIGNYNTNSCDSKKIQTSHLALIVSSEIWQQHYQKVILKSSIYLFLIFIHSYIICVFSKNAFTEF